MNHYQMTERASAQVEIDFLRTELNKANEKLRDASLAKQLLASKGFYVENLWHVDDVMQNYHCNKDVAYDILHRVFNDESVTESIFNSVDDYCRMLDIKPTPEQL